MKRKFRSNFMEICEKFGENMEENWRQALEIHQKYLKRTFLSDILLSNFSKTWSIFFFCYTSPSPKLASTFFYNRISFEFL